jgi:glucokinase
MGQVRTIGVDVGGTKIAAGLVDEDGQVSATTRRDTPSTDPERIEEAISDVVRDLSYGQEIEAVGLAAAGLVDADRSTVLFAPNLAWRREPLREAVEKRCGVPARRGSARAGARPTSSCSRSAPAWAAASCSPAGCTAGATASPRNSGT